MRTLIAAPCGNAGPQAPGRPFADDAGRRVLSGGYPRGKFVRGNHTAAALLNDVGEQRHHRGGLAVADLHLKRTDFNRQRIVALDHDDLD